MSCNFGFTKEFKLYWVFRPQTKHFNICLIFGFNCFGVVLIKAIYIFKLRVIIGISITTSTHRDWLIFTNEIIIG
ncbi:hypothetical protein D3C80_1143020 [compost metagenome]